MQAKKEIAPDSNNGGEGGGPCNSKKDPYTVAAWKLTKKEDKVQMHSKDYFWCTGNHWSGGTKHNGMYADHKSCDHTSWRSCMDKRCKNGNENNGQLNETPSKPVEAPSQKLALNDKLCNAFCTWAGLSAEAIGQIWQDVQGNE
jgi:hypothetical protein